MSELEKAKFLLRFLSKHKLEFNGAREAFSFTQSYTWLINMAKDLEKKDKDGDKG